MTRAAILASVNKGFKTLADGVQLDREHMTAQFAPGIVVALHPFFGSMGVAPPGSITMNSETHH